MSSLSLNRTLEFWLSLVTNLGQSDNNSWHSPLLEHMWPQSDSAETHLAAAQARA